MAGGSIAKHYRTLTQAAITVGATSTLVIAANAIRNYLLIQSIADEVIYLMVDGAAVMTEGTQLPAMDTDGNSQGAIEYSFVQGNLHNKAVYAICASGSKTLLVTEG